MMVKPLAAVEELEVNSGQRYSVLLERTNSYATNETVFRIDVGVRWRPSGPTGIGLLQYKSGNLTADSQALVAAMSSLPLYPPNSASNPPSQPDWVLSQLRPHGPHYQPPPAQSTRAIILTGRQANVSLPVAHNKHTAINETTNYHIKWIINDQYWMPPMDGSLLEQLMFAETDFTTADKSPLVFTIELNQVIDIVLQNTVALNGLCEQHPWHLHGHHFWDYGGGPGLYDPVLGAQLTANNSEPIMRDTTTLYPYQSAYFQPQILPPGSPCGWRLLRFRADNPGLWNMHCHIAAHMHMGMQVFFLEAPLTLRYLMRSQSIGPDGQWNP
jgi:L-ascorbate oxidase